MAVTKVWDGSNWIPLTASVEATSGDFLPLTGGVLTGYLTLHSDPVNPLHAATKSYVDTTKVESHDELSGVTSSQHHTRYADSEARAAVVGLYLPLTGGTLTGTLESQSINPRTNDAYSLGASSQIWRRIFTKFLYDTANLPAAEVFTGGMKIGDDTRDVDGKQVLTLGIARTWNFSQRGTGASAGLEMYSSSNKTLYIGNVTAGDGLFMDAAARFVLMQPAQTENRSTALRNIMIAPTSLGGTTPAPMGGDGHILIKYTA